MRSSIHLSHRLEALPPYLAADIKARVSALKKEGADIIDLSVGSPDFPPDHRIVDAAREVLESDGGHGYVIGRGGLRLREAAAAYMARRYGVEVDPASQLLVLLGSKEGLAHLPIALCNPGEVGVYPDPGYPVYEPALRLAGARPVPLPLDPDRDWRPQWDRLDASISALESRDNGDKGDVVVRLVILNYPHNPTSATAELADFDTAIEWAGGHGAVTVNDNAYADIGFDGYRPPGILQAPRALGGRPGSGVVEFHSMSKTFSMAGWRCGFAVGDPEVISALARVKSYYDTGGFAAVQHGAVTALDLAGEIAPQVSERYRVRRDVLLAALSPLGLVAETPKATIYLWARLPEPGADDAAYCRDLLDRAHVALSPGSGYGRQGRGYVRFSLTAPEDRLLEAVTRLKRFGETG